MEQIEEKWQGVEVIDSDTVRELSLYIDNESEIYFNHTLPVLRMINKHYKRGQGNIEKAVKALERYVVQVAARRYLSEFGSGSDSIRSVFPKVIRLQVALQLFYAYQDARNAGDYFWEQKQEGEKTQWHK